MSEQPVIVLVHGAFAESAGWNRVIRVAADTDHHRFCADVDAGLSAATRRPVTERAGSRGTREIAASQPDAAGHVRG